MKRLQEGSSMSDRAALKLYKEITDKFRPVFHHFFLEHFPQPAQWFERRLESFMATLSPVRRFFAGKTEPQAPAPSGAWPPSRKGETGSGFSRAGGEPLGEAGHEGNKVAMRRREELRS